MDLYNKVLEAVKTVKDPEIPVSLYDMGVIYDVTLNEDNSVVILATFTAPNCPEADHIMGELKHTVEAVEGVKSCLIEITFEPFWTPDMIRTEEAKLELGLL